MLWVTTGTIHTNTCLCKCLFSLIYVLIHANLLTICAPLCLSLCQYAPLHALCIHYVPHKLFKGHLCPYVLLYTPLCNTYHPLCVSHYMSLFASLPSLNTLYLLSVPLYVPICTPLCPCIPSMLPLNLSTCLQVPFYTSFTYFFFLCSLFGTLHNLCAS